MKQTEILVKSALDGSMQPSLFYRSEATEKRPLLVGLHTWSHNRFNQIDNMLPYAEKYDFSLLLPESKTFLDIFDGGHEIDMETAMYWFVSQYKSIQKTTVTG